MSLQVDKAAPWRSVALGGGRAPRIIQVRAAMKGHDQGPASDDIAVTDVSTDKWLRDLERVAITEEVARNGMMTGAVNADVEFSSSTGGSADDAICRLATLPYMYTGANSTRVEYTFAGKCFVVRPAINETVVSAMYSAPTADKWAQATGIKLPRVTAQSQSPGAVPGMPSTGLATPVPQQGFDSLRKHVVSCARGDDYGDRLFHLARVVLHAQVLRTLRHKPGVTPAMQAANAAYSIAAADTPNLLPSQLMDPRLTYLYVHTDTSADYRAFLTMGVRGVQHYAGAVDSAYSACVSEEEARAEDKLVFVRVGGDAPSPASPGADAYTRVLGNPGACLAYYFAYAQSMGLGRQAAAVLVQAALAPHIWGDHAVSPYRTGQPRLDACTYVLLPDQDVAHVVIDDIATVVHSAAIIGLAYKAAIGGALMSYKTNRQVNDSLVVEQYVERLTDPEARRPLMASITSLLFTGGVGMEWFSPFSYDVQSGYAACIDAYRNYGYLLSMFNRCPIGGLTQLFSGGVDMTNSMVGQGMSDHADSYAQTTGILMAAGCQLLGACEKWSVRHTAQLPQVAALTRSWRLVVTLVRFVAVHPHTSKLEDSPGKWRKEELQDSTITSGEGVQSNRQLSSPASSRSGPAHGREPSDTAIPVSAVFRAPQGRKSRPTSTSLTTPRVAVASGAVQRRNGAVPPSTSGYIGDFTVDEPPSAEARSGETDNTTSSRSLRSAEDSSGVATVRGPAIGVESRSRQDWAETTDSENESHTPADALVRPIAGGGLSRGRVSASSSGAKTVTSEKTRVMQGGDFVI